MEIIVEPRGKSGSGSDPAQKIGEALELLESEAEHEKFQHIRALAAVLNDHTPLSYLAPLTPRQVGDRLGAFFQFIDDRREEAAARFLACADKGQVLLLTNSPDAPYLLDSLQNFLSARCLHVQVVAHPILTVRRRKGRVVELSGLTGAGDRESFLILKIDGLAEKRPQFLLEVLAVVRMALQVDHDSGAIRKRLKEVEDIPGIDDYREFWTWLQDRNFIPFSAWRLQVEEDREGEKKVLMEQGSALGLPPEPKDLVSGGPCPLVDLESSARTRLERPGPVMVEETRRLSPVHRNERLVYLGIRERLGENSWREHAFLGLFSGKSVQELAFNIPALRRRIEEALQTLRIPPTATITGKPYRFSIPFPKSNSFSWSRMSSSGPSSPLPCSTGRGQSRSSPPEVWRSGA